MKVRTTTSNQRKKRILTEKPKSTNALKLEPEPERPLFQDSDSGQGQKQVNQNRQPSLVFRVHFAHRGVVEFDHFIVTFDCLAHLCQHGL
jgi:hypothetical protein